MDNNSDNKSNDNCQSQLVTTVNSQSFISTTVSQTIHHTPNPLFHVTHSSENLIIQQDPYTQWRRQQQEEHERRDQQRIQERELMCQHEPINYQEYYREWIQMDDEYHHMQLEHYLEWENLEIQELEDEYNEQLKQIEYVEQMEREEQMEKEEEWQQRNITQLHEREHFEQQELMEQLKHLKHLQQQQQQH
jgi:hypothetical protein